jgi:hypothetical protein
LTPEFIPRAELCRLFFAEVVKPLIDDAFPRLRYAAALLGSGSEVLGFDTAMSTDHDWGPRVDLFVGEDDIEDVRLGLRDTALHSWVSVPQPSGEQRLGR